MKASMICYAAAVLSFYLAVSVMFVAEINVLGLALVCMGILSLAAGVVFHALGMRRSHTESGAAMETAAASL